MKAGRQNRGPDPWTAKHQARQQRLSNYVRKNRGKSARDGTGNYKLDKLRYRSFAYREGYDDAFLGSVVALPEIDKSVASQVATRIDDPGNAELEYTNFSIVMNKMRRQPFFTAVNIDGKTSTIVRDKVRWAYEGRILPQHQLGNVAYTKNDIDRGHMVHGQSAASGPNPGLGRADTYVYTNASLQHKGLNQEEWVDLENQLLDEARNEDSKLTVFAGPVFDKNDKYFDNGGRIKPAVQMPRSYWKVLVWNDPDKGIQSESYVMSQAEDLKRKTPGPEYQDGADMTKYQVPLSQVEELTNLHFEDLEGSDTFKDH